MPNRSSAVAAALLLAVTAAGLEESAPPYVQAQPIAQFLEAVRNGPPAECWIRTGATVRHKAGRGAQTETFALELRGRFTAHLSEAQVTFNGRERHRVTQKLALGLTGFEITEQVAAAPGTRSLQDIGLRPGDLTLSFLYWKFQREHEPEEIKHQWCRVVTLNHPDDGRRARVWISVKYGFPLKVQWGHAEDGPWRRELAITGFQRVNDLWVLKALRVTDGNWKTEVRFENDQVHLITPDRPAPEDLFLR